MPAKVRSADSVVRNGDVGSWESHISTLSHGYSVRNDDIGLSLQEKVQYSSRKNSKLGWIAGWLGYRNVRVSI